MRCTVPSLLVVAALAAGDVAAQDAARSRPPNVLFVAIDDLNDWIGALGGHPQARTPNLDRLAARGVLFSNAHCAAPACNPSRAALLTGIAPHRSGVYLNSHPWRPALPDAVTIPQHFRGHGYTALGSGKIFHGGFPDPQSWDRYFPSKRKQTPNDPQPASKPLNGIARTRHFDWGPVAVDDAAMGDAQVAAWVSEQLGRRHERPFFLACGFFRPHLPWYVPQRYFDLFPLDEIQLPVTRADDLADVPPAGRAMARPGGDHRKVVEHGQWRRAVQAYLASIAFTDAMLGRVIEALDGGPHADDTLVVLWTDHGWHLGEKQHWRKFALWEEATRTPLIVVAPRGAGAAGRIPAGARCDRPVSLLDVYPTLTELCGLPARDGLSGRSLVPLLRDPAAAWDGVALTTHGRHNHAVRDQRWRYIRYADGGEELYDHDADPMEWTNLAGMPEHAAVKARLGAQLPRENANSAKRRKQKK